MRSPKRVNAMNVTALLASATAATAPSFPGVAVDETWKWAVQTGGFGALFAVTVWVALKWLASRLDTLSTERKEAQEAERETLHGVVKSSNEALARLIPILERLEARERSVSDKRKNGHET